MKMAKATEKDIEAALLLLGMLEDVDSGKFPRGTELHGSKDDDPEDFNENDPDHLRAFHDRIMTCVKLRPSGISRVIWGFQTILDNNVLDPNVDHLELHPRLKRTEQFAEWLNQLHEVLRNESASHERFDFRALTADDLRVMLKRELNMIQRIDKSVQDLAQAFKAEIKAAAPQEETPA